MKRPWESLSFWDLTAKYGTPHPVIPNSPRLLTNRRGGFNLFTRDIPPIISPAITWYHRLPFGEAEFLLVKAQVEMPLAQFSELQPELQKARIVEYQRLANSLVRVSFEQDVSPLSREEVQQASAARRLVAAWSISNMDDRQVRLEALMPGRLPEDNSLNLLFPSQAGPSEAELLEVNPLWPYDSLEEFFEAYKSYITRPLSISPSAGT